ncbi:MAG: bifunctional hydroxymethylpyrimidine kinase/phosphomethylpyrimidine kinase [Rhodanobacteraceae bacterium]
MLRKSDKSSKPLRDAPPLVLAIAGSDSGGGAGIQADLRTFATFGVHGLCVLTAITAQNTRGVMAVNALSTAIIQAQIDALLADFQFDVVKVGMLATPAIVRLVASTLQRHPRLKLVLDPVLVATTGASLGGAAVATAIRRHLLPRADLVTPNWPEAHSLLERTPTDGADQLSLAMELQSAGAKAVLLKGGHLPGERMADLLLTSAGSRWFTHERLPVEGHGTGCTLASAIAAGLASGLTLSAATAQAVDYVQRALIAGYRPGRGSLRVLDHSVISLQGRD